MKTSDCEISAGMRSFLVLGGGSAGLLSALTLRQAFPKARITLVRSPTKEVIGVGESTTRAFPIFLHGILALPRAEFYREVQPVWKLGNRLEWGTAEVSHFNYPFDGQLLGKSPRQEKANLYYCGLDMAHAGLFSSLMDQGRSPFVPVNNRLTVVEQFAYHIDNRKFLAHLERIATNRNIEFVAGDFAVAVRSEDGNFSALRLTDGRELAADFFIDCSGFASLLLGKTLGERFITYSDRLFCDRAVVGSWPRQVGEAIKPYTVTQTMKYGWCWEIGFHDHINRGYVYASAFCTDEQAREEFRQVAPRVSEELRLIRFPTGRYDRFWVGNVAAVGNSAGFIEPMESTALQLIIEELRLLCKALLDCQERPPAPRMVELENRRSAARWEDVRDFLAVHYKFNRRIESPFWSHCRETVDLGRAAEFVEYYQEVGPTMLASDLLPEPSIFGYEGYMTLLLGQQVPTRRPKILSDREIAGWRAHQNDIRSQAASALSMDQAWQLIHDPQFRWAVEARA